MSGLGFGLEDSGFQGYGLGALRRQAKEAGVRSRAGMTQLKWLSRLLN